MSKVEEVVEQPDRVRLISLLIFTMSNVMKGSMMRETRRAVREVSGDAAGGSGLSVGTAFAMIRKDIQELERQAARPQAEPAVLEQRLHEIAAQIDALQSSVPSRGGGGAGMEEFVAQLQALLAHNETKLAALQQQIAATAANAISGPAESIRRDVASLKEIQASVDRRTQDTFEAVYGTIERIVDRLAVLEEELRDRDRHSGATADPPSADPQQRGTLPARPATAAETLAPSDGAGMSVMLRQPAFPDGKAQVPARLAAAPVKAESEPCPPPLVPAGLVAARRAALKLSSTASAGMRSGTLRARGKVAVLGVGVVLAVLFAVTFALDFYRSSDVPDPLPPGAEDKAMGDADADVEVARPADPTLLIRQGFNVSPPASGSASPRPDGSPPAQTAAAPADAVTPEVEFSPLMRNALLPTQAGGDPWPRSEPPAAEDLTAKPLPSAIGSKALVEAAAAGDPGASYEIAIRFSQGRNAGRDFAMAAAWLGRAAQAGLAPAQFRLGSMYEKGLGVRKDLAEARRLYVDAAAKGHAKAMHNLAVLYTGGIDGGPDFASAAEWFRKAAAYGVVDSQYNLGILYARGNGVERDLAESYKWFVLAAKAGDKEAARKRDEVAKGLDPKQLESARQAAESFIRTPQPEEATSAGAPPGGWDKAAATTKSRPSAKPERSPVR